MQTAAFTPETTRAILHKAGKQLDLDTSGATLIRMGENAMYRLESPPIMVRIGRSPAAAEKERNVAAWLADHDFPAVHLADFQQPVLVDDYAVTFWKFIEESLDSVTEHELGGTLRALHDLPTPSAFSLPPFEPMPKIAPRLSAIGDRLPVEDRMFISERKAELEEEFSGLSFSLGVGVVHGDYHPGNLMRDQAGIIRLIDFEDFVFGPREWDACVEAVRYWAFGWVSPEDYRSYVDAYGFDPLDWDGFPVMRAIRELNMTTWLAQLLGQSDEVDKEVHKRIADLRNGQRLRNWSTF
ncbi:aminoglycoside phosphotransferase family protein [Saccharopolyspora shandongensis]|uniref:phosphotransferase enzyme family protein n=1 Tax=Saccharopolyspora shandongensis TaxID=418495 RepID=UPI00341F17F3